MSHRNSKKSNRLGISIAKHRALHPNPFAADTRAAVERQDRQELNNFILHSPNSPIAPQRAIDIPVDAPSLSPSPSSSEISNLKSPSISPLPSTLPSQRAIDIPVDVSSPSSASQISTSNSQLAKSSAPAPSSELSTLNSQPAASSVHSPEISNLKSPSLSPLPSTLPSQRAIDIPVDVSSPSSASQISTSNSQLAKSSAPAPSSELSTLNSQPAASSVHSPEISNLKSPSISPSPSTLPSQRAIDIPVDVPLLSSTPSPSSSEISNLKSPSLAPPPSTSPLPPTSSATRKMHELQSFLDTHTINYENPDEVAQLGQLLTVYAQLQNSAAVERISESLDQVGAGYKREPLTRELTKVLSIQDRALARAQRERTAKERDQRRIEREAKRELAQAAKQARDDKLFKQRENHLARNEKIVNMNHQTQLLRQQTNKRSKSQRVEQVHSAAPSAHSSPPSAVPLCHSATLPLPPA